jgi:hypothetical protein
MYRGVATLKVGHRAAHGERVTELAAADRVSA